MSASVNEPNKDRPATRTEVCDMLLTVAASTLVTMPTNYVASLLFQLSDGGMDEMSARAQSRLYNCWGGDTAFSSHVKSTASGLGVVLAARPEMVAARAGWRLLDAREKTIALQTLVDFSCSWFDTAAPKVVLDPAASETPRLREAMREPAKLRINPAHISGCFEDAADEALRQAAYHVFTQMAGARMEEGDPLSPMARVFALNASKSGYVANAGDMAHRRQPIEFQATMFALVVMDRLEAQEPARRYPLRFEVPAPKLVM